MKVAPTMLAAGFGGLAPNLLQIAIDLTGKRDPGVNVGMCLGLLLFAAMGAVVALIWKEQDVRKAFYLGIGLPSLIQLSVAQATRAGARNEQANFSFFAAPAFAGIPPELMTASSIRIEASAAIPEASTALTRLSDGRVVRLDFHGLPAGAELVFTSADGKTTAPVPLADAQRQAHIAVPDWATGFELTAQGVTSKRAALPTSGNAAYKVEVHDDNVGSFWRALGVQTASTIRWEVSSRPVPPDTAAH